MVAVKAKACRPVAYSTMRSPGCIFSAFLRCPFLMPCALKPRARVLAMLSGEVTRHQCVGMRNDPLGVFSRSIPRPPVPLDHNRVSHASCSHGPVHDIGPVVDCEIGRG